MGWRVGRGPQGQVQLRRHLRAAASVVKQKMVVVGNRLHLKLTVVGNRLDLTLTALCTLCWFNRHVERKRYRLTPRF